MALFNLGAFIHGLNIYNLTKGNVIEEPQGDPNAVQNMVAQMNYLRSQHNSEMEYLDRMEMQAKIDAAGISNALRSLTAHMADRLALHRTLLDIERCWERGDIVSICCVKSNENRGVLTRKLIEHQWDAKEALEAVMTSFRADDDAVFASMQTLQISRHHSAPSPPADDAPNAGAIQKPYILGVLGLAIDAERHGLAKAADHIEQSWAKGADIKASYAEAASIRRQAYHSYMQQHCCESWHITSHFSMLANNADQPMAAWEDALVKKTPLSDRKTSFFFVQNNFY